MEPESLRKSSIHLFEKSKKHQQISVSYQKFYQEAVSSFTPLCHTAIELTTKKITTLHVLVV